MNTLKLGFRISKTAYDKQLSGEVSKEVLSKVIKDKATEIMMNTITLDKFMKTTETEDEFEFELEIVIQKDKVEMSYEEIGCPKE